MEGGRQKKICPQKKSCLFVEEKLDTVGAVRENRLEKKEKKGGQRPKTI